MRVILVVLAIMLIVLYGNMSPKEGLRMIPLCAAAAIIGLLAGSRRSE